MAAGRPLSQPSLFDALTAAQSLGADDVFQNSQRCKPQSARYGLSTEIEKLTSKQTWSMNRSASILNQQHASMSTADAALRLSLPAPSYTQRLDVIFQAALSCWPPLVCYSSLERGIQ